jgi:hypothetical protein
MFQGLCAESPCNEAEPDTISEFLEIVIERACIVINHFYIVIDTEEVNDEDKCSDPGFAIMHSYCR